MPASINYAPSLTPAIKDPTAPTAQAVCPGYRASNVQESDSGVTADLTLAGPSCNAYGTDIQDLTLSVEYQSQNRLAVRIEPKYITDENQTHFLLSPELTPQPSAESGASNSSSDLVFTWSNEPSFQFQVARASSGDVLFNTYGSVIVFEDQFLELVTQMVPNYNIYGFAGNVRGFRLPNNYTRTFWNNYNLTNDQIIDANGHDTQPMYLETRYASGTSTSHGVYARNAHGQDWVLESDELSYRTIGGSFEFYFFSGPGPKDVISQYQTAIQSTPFIPAYWNLGFFQCRWGYQNWTNLQDVVDLYAQAGIQLEAIMTDLDPFFLNRAFTLNERYNAQDGKVFLDRLHANGQYYLPIGNPHIYTPAPDNATDVASYPIYGQGNSMNAYISNGEGEWYYGVEWPGFSVWVDFHPQVPQAQEFWTQQVVNYHNTVDFDGIWIDVTDPTSFCTGDCGMGQLDLNPIHVPFPLPGDSDTMLAVNYMYPEGFAVTNASEAASASAALASQSAAYPIMPSPTPTVGRSIPTPGVRNLNFPPYAINNALGGGALYTQIIAPNATSNDPLKTLQYDIHNLYGHLAANATYHALLAARPGLRSFFAARSTFPGTGSFAGHWGGDTNSAWGNMYFGISQALSFSIAGVPYFGVETCGFNDNTDMELCTRWMQLSAWYPFYRNHNNRNTIAQEAYRWSTTITSTQIIMNIRYSLLPYTYTLFYQANLNGSTVLRALAWEFPDDPSLANVETQFMSGPALLITPVLVPLATTVQGVFPGIATGTIWYDYYTLQPLSVGAGENITLSAPLTHQNIHVRGGYIIPMQAAGNTTKTSRMNPWSLLIALDANGNAEGSLYLDDGLSVVQSETKTVTFSYTNNTLTTFVSGSYDDGIPLGSVTIAGFAKPSGGEPPSGSSSLVSVPPTSVVTSTYASTWDQWSQSTTPAVVASSAPESVVSSVASSQGWESWKEVPSHTKRSGDLQRRQSGGGSGMQQRLENGTLYVTGLEGMTSSGAWASNLTIAFGVGST